MPTSATKAATDALVVAAGVSIADVLSMVWAPPGYWTIVSLPSPWSVKNSVPSLVTTIIDSRT